MKIYQIYYKQNQISKLEREFIPFDNTANERPEWREYFVFREAFRKGLMQENLSGFFSWKFESKAKVRGHHLIKFIEDHPGYDVYCINPFQEEAALYLNCWEQGEKYHPGILNIAQSFFEQTGFRVSLKDIIMTAEQTNFCNYFVATEAFWRRYFEFCEPFFALIESDLSEEEKNTLNLRADKMISADYRVFIFERLFSTFLVLHKDIRFKSYEYSKLEIEQQYGELASLIFKARDLKAEISKNFSVAKLEEFKKISIEAQKHAAYGSNSAWWRRKLQWLKPHFKAKRTS